MKSIFSSIALLLVALQSFAQQPCSVSITTVYDSLTQAHTLTANPTGTAPFSYTWGNWGNGQSITVPDSLGISALCVFVTDAAGCTTVACDTIWNSNPCFTAGIYVRPIQGTTLDQLVSWNQSNTPVTYIWSTGETTSQITVTTSGNYCLTVSDGQGCDVASCYYYQSSMSCGVNITQTTNPASGVTTLTAAPNGTAPFTYAWSNNLGNMPTVVLPNLLPGVYCVTMTDANGCISSTCDSVGIQAPCFATGIVERPVQGTTLDHLIAWHQSNGSVTYNWSTGETSNQITVSTSGNYCVTISDGQGCAEVACYYYQPNTTTPCQANFYVYVDSLNPTPFNLTVVNNSTSNSGAITYTWSFGDGSTGTGAYPTHTYANTGIYLLCLTISDQAGCSSTHCDTIGVDASGNVLFRQGFSLNVVSPTALSVEGQNDLEMALFPNPTSGEVQVRFNGTNEEATLAVFDIMGRQIESRNIAPTAGLQVESLSLSNQPAGQYLIRLVSGNSQQSLKVVKQ